MKMPPIEKISEAYTAVVDGRITVFENYATVKSSNGQKEYLIKWKDNTYYSNDNSTYWQGYAGYPVIAVLMLQEKLSYNEELARFFRGINWNELNKKNKSDYKKSVDDILSDVDETVKDDIFKEIDNVYRELENLDIVLSRKKDLS